MNQPDQAAGLPPMTADPRIPMPGFSPLPPPPPGPANPDPPVTPAPGPSATKTGRHAGDAWNAATSIPGSTDGDGGGGKPDLPFKTKRATFTKLAETALKALGGLLNRAVAADEDDECFLPDDDDLDTIPPPLGRLGARRVKVPIDEENVSDAEDLIAAAIGLAAWAFKGIVDWAMARRARRQATAGAVVAPADELAAQNGAGT